MFLHLSAIVDKNTSNSLLSKSVSPKKILSIFGHLDKNSENPIQLHEYEVKFEVYYQRESIDDTL
jgi:hypothetical protein